MNVKFILERKFHIKAHYQVFQEVQGSLLGHRDQDNLCLPYLQDGQAYLNVVS